MATYAVGDLQGCLAPLQCLLREVSFDPQHDTLWLVGDLVNRGPQSLETLRFVKSLGSSAVVVLGNHDLHLLAIYFGVRQVSASLREIIDAPDVDELMHWLRHQPLLHVDRALNIAMSHAGILPTWSLAQAQALAGEVETVLRGPRSALPAFFKHMYGDEPRRWRDDLDGESRLRAIVNAFTRMRLCSAKGKLDLETSDSAVSSNPKYAPWFSYPNPGLEGVELVFGHWAALQGKVGVAGIYGLDTGCVWGGAMTMMRLDDKQRFTCKCSADGEVA
ncbi:MAG TPA: symmetrical bis(5'-nucleosyl)-tetraphosphatase [Pseudomonadales bacterium]|nr:symmetrical bis(5'-nucleosyl)-tetraphosphatase [Pseudomonadales bacterium]